MWLQEEKGLRQFGGFLFGIKTVPTHLALGIAEDAVRIQGQECTAEMVAGKTQLA